MFFLLFTVDDKIKKATYYITVVVSDRRYLKLLIQLANLVLLVKRHTRAKYKVT